MDVYRTSGPGPLKWACPECGHRQDADERCATCGYDGLMDLDNPQHLDFLRQIDSRRRERYTDRARMLSVLVAMVLVFGIWCIPGFWTVRRQAFALPLLIDQWGFMAVVALGLTKVADRLAPKSKFPYVEP